MIFIITGPTRFVFRIDSIRFYNTRLDHILSSYLNVFKWETCISTGDPHIPTFNSYLLFSFTRGNKTCFTIINTFEIYIYFAIFSQLWFAFKIINCHSGIIFQIALFIINFILCVQIDSDVLHSLQTSSEISFPPISSLAARDQRIILDETLLGSLKLCERLLKWWVSSCGDHRVN